MPDLHVRCAITTPKGMLELNSTPYRLAGDTTATRQVSYRRQTVSSPYVPGTWTVNAVPDTITETVAVRVDGVDHVDMTERLDELVAAFGQFVYLINWEVGESSYSWHCQVADATIDTRREFLHAKMAIATFQVPRYPGLF